MHRFFIIILLTTVFCTAALAQNDTLRQGNAVPLFDNLQSDSVEINQQGQQLLQNESESETGAAIRVLERYYNAGKYPDALRMSRYISDNLRLNRDETQRFLLYTIASYKEMSYDEQADSTMMIFTHKFPFYEPQTYDPLSFREVFNNYNIIPRVAVFVSITSLGSPIVKIDSIFPCADTTKYIPMYLGEKNKGITIGVQIGLTKKFALATGIGYSVLSFSRTEDHKNTTFIYNEKDIFCNIPVSLLYDLPQWKTPIKGVVVFPSIFAGGSVTFITKSKYEAYTWFGDNTQYTISDKEADLNDKIRVNYSVFGGIRSVLGEWGRLSFFTEGSFHYMFRALNNPDNRYNNSDLVFNNLYVPDAIHLFSLELRFGFKYNLVYKTIPKFGYGYKK